jgi:hypothetical protein
LLNGLTPGTVRDLVMFCGLTFLVGNVLIYFFHIVIVKFLESLVSLFKLLVGFASPFKSVLSLRLELLVDLLKSVEQGTNFLLAGNEFSRPVFLDNARFRENFFNFLFLFRIGQQFNFFFQLFTQRFQHEHLLFQFVILGENLKAPVAHASVAAVPD